MMDFSASNPVTTNSLNLASRMNDTVNVQRLLKKINPNCVDNRGWTCLHEAAFYDSFESLQIILNHSDCRPLIESHEGHTALYVACMDKLAINKSLRCIEYLLSSVEDIANYGSKEGCTPLHLVSQNGWIDAMQLLLDHGALMDVQDFDGDTPLHEACLSKQPMAVTVLLHAGAQAEIANELSVLPMHIACSNGCLESVSYLLPFTSDINATTYNGDTILMAAVSGQNVEIVDLILLAGADPNRKKPCGNMALDIALSKGDVNIFKKIFTATDRQQINKNLIYFVLSPHCLNIAIIEFLLNSDLEPEFYLYTNTELVKRTGLCEVVIIFHNYNDIAPLNSFLNICEYMYKQCPNKFRENFFLYLMKGVSANALHSYEVPPLVWLHFCPHSECFKEVLEILIDHDCDVDYCSFDRQSNDGDKFKSTLMGRNLYTSPLQNERIESSEFTVPDAFFASMTMDSSTIPVMIPYSLQCDPGFILDITHQNSVSERFPPKFFTKLLSMIDDDNENAESNIYKGKAHYDQYKCRVLSLKHLSRMNIRYAIKRKDGLLRSTREFLNILDQLPLPNSLKMYIRFIKN